jgi:tight adherence protein C
LSALSVFALCLVLSWPYLAPDPFKERVQRIAFDRDGSRLPPPNGDARHARTSKPGQTLQKIFDRMNLSSQAENGEVAKRLRMAGFRGESPVVTFLTIRLLAPPTLFAVAIIYIYAVLQLPHPFFVKLAMATAAACCGYFLPSIYIRNKIAKRQKAFRRGWPDALDLTLICVEAGMSAERAFQKVSEEIRAQSPIVAEELELTTAELSHLPERRKAYENFAQRTGLDGVNAVMTSLIQAEKYGSPIAQALRVLAQESRDTRMAEAEKKAASLPPKLTVPMIVFFLPVLFAVIITPMAIQFATTPLH